jgi:hypothetical protein
MPAGALNAPPPLLDMGEIGVVSSAPGTCAIINLHSINDAVEAP